MAKFKIIMTGGGSAGHVTPNLALIPELVKHDFEIKYIGTETGIERSIIEKTNLTYYAISSGKLRRYFDIKNFTDPFKVIKGIFEAIKIIKKEKPNVVFSKGGFVSVPVVIGAALNKVPIVCHESDITPGLANKITVPYCTKICVTFPEALEHLKNSKAVLTGTPIREELLQGNKINGLNICGFKDNKPVILIIGGSLGSVIINNTVRASLDKLLLKYNIAHICGKGNIDESLKNKKGYRQFEYINEELPHLFALSDIAISRAGANTLFELLALKKPNIIIPLSRKSSRGDQILNAKSFNKRGYSVVIEEENLKEELLISEIENLLKNKEKFSSIMGKSPMQNGISNVVNVIMQAMNK
jgi:UDP-N-acetylglucosamine--N-acetylmuramyl-(pentapeptide) pyrophosphoryl-undecaprenol N-acetylglucosamine transferase